MDCCKSEIDSLKAKIDALSAEIKAMENHWKADYDQAVHETRREALEEAAKAVDARANWALNSLTAAELAARGEALAGAAHEIRALKGKGVGL